MSVLLQVWQQQLEEYFGHLAEERGAEAPLFALEHPLSADQLALLGNELKELLKIGIFSSKHWLAWVVYAAEQGYEFDGEEYWQTFSEKTPHWYVPGEYRRRGIRKWFMQFQKRFHGVTPSGAWAGQFINIAWPITHAVLPKDLQYYFARGLWNARYQLVAKVVKGDPEAIGRIIRLASDDASSRFKQFAQQESLVGRLALALLDDTRERPVDLLSARTLDRIVGDLERTRNAREWLQETRRQIYRFTGVARPKANHARTDTSQSRIEGRPSIRPTLQLRRIAADQWQVCADLPSFAPLAAADAQIGELVRRSRCTVQGGAGTWRPGGWLLAGGRVQPLRQWPAQDSPLLSFEQKHKGMELVLQSEGTLSKGPIWPCLVSEDGVAREVLGRSLRSGSNYVLLHVGPLAGSLGLSLKPCRTDCVGINATQLNIPALVDAQQIAAIEKLGLRIARSVRLWPVGLLPRRWDGEGHGEWLTTERPNFGLVHDSPVDSYLVTLNGANELCIKSQGTGVPSFLQLPPLPVGEHRLRVRTVWHLQTQLGCGVTQPAPSEGEIILSVREPAPLATGSTPHGGLTVVADPPLPDLDDFLNDVLVLSVQGPAGRKVSVSVTERNPSGEPVWSKKLEERELPTTIKNWSQLLSDESRLKLESASTATVAIDGEELGEYQLRLQHDVAPLRWTSREFASGRDVRLIVEAGLASEPTVSLRRFASPLRKESLDARECVLGISVPERGGLYLVESRWGIQGLVVSVAPRNLGLADLRLQPQVGHPTTFFAMVELLIGVEVWSEARLLGPWAQMWRAQVVEALRGALIRWLCGEEWWRAEVGYQMGPPTDDALMNLGDALGRDYKARGFAAALRQYRRVGGSAITVDRLSAFNEICRRFSVCDDSRLCELSLRVASNPSMVRQWAGPDLESLLAQAGSVKSLLPGARLAVLAVADSDSKQKDPAWHW